jgi:hypothetical protein
MKELTDWIFLTVMTNSVVRAFMLVLLLAWGFELMIGSHHRLTGWLVKMPFHLLRKLLAISFRLLKEIFGLLTHKRSTTGTARRRTTPAKKTTSRKVTNSKRAG